MRGKRNYKLRNDVEIYQMYLDTKKCNRCAIELKMHDTWCEGNAKKRNYICKKCDSIKGRENRLKRLAINISNHALKQYNKAKDGYVYAITNPAWEGWVKIGMAVDADDRCKSYQTSSPLRDYKLEHCTYFEDRRKAEQQAHEKAEEIAEECGSEWFKIPVDKAVKIIGDLK